MENEVNSSNPQATPDVAAPPSTGTQVDYAARVAELERQSEGRLRDLQEERRKRQELEQRLSAVPASPAANPGVEPQDEVAKVLNPYIAPIQQKAEEALKFYKQLEAQQREDAALKFLSEKTGKAKEQILTDTAFQDRLTKTAQKWGFVGPIDEVARRAYEAMELEDFRNQQLEKARASQAAAQASLPAGAPPASVSKTVEYSAEDFSRLPAREFDRLSREGNFRKVDGKFVYTPR